MLLIATTNDSAGVNLEEIEMIFDRHRALDYFERKSARGFSFQGDMRLAICHSLVVRLHGEITVESTPNAQTTFTVRLPQLQVTGRERPRRAAAHRRRQHRLRTAAAARPAAGVSLRQEAADDVRRQ